MDQVFEARFCVSTIESANADIVSLKKARFDEELGKRVAQVRYQERRSLYYHKGEWKQSERGDRVYYQLCDYLFLANLEDASIGEFVFHPRVLPPDQKYLQIINTDGTEWNFRQVGNKNLVWERIS